MTWALTWPITIDDTNKYIDIDEDNGSGGAGIVAATIATGTYRDVISDSSVAGSLAAAIKTAFELVCNGTCTVTVSDSGIYTIANTIVFELGWLNGANAANSARYVLGWKNVDASPQALAHTAPYQHRNGFYSGSVGPDQEADDYFWRAEHHAPLRRANSGKQSRRPFGSTQEFIDLDFGFIPSSKIDAATTDYDAYKSLRDLYDYIVGGDHRYFRWYRDTSTPTDTDTYDDVWWDTPDRFEYVADRMGNGVELWTASMKLWKHVS